MSQPRVSFIIVTYDNADTIEACLLSVKMWTRDTYDVTIVDNSGDHLTRNAVSKFHVSHPEVEVRVIASGENLGFAKGCNLGARHSAGEYLFFLNPDTQLMNDAAKFLAECLEAHPSALAAGPAIFGVDGKVTRTCRNLPNLGRVILDASGIDSFLGCYKLVRFRHDVPRKVDQIIGAAMLVRRSDYDHLGGLDERFFVYFEEVDLCKRFREEGGKVWFWPKAQVKHLAGRSCEVSSARARMIVTFRESRKKYFAKHFGRSASLAVEVINRIEGVQKALVLFTLWSVLRKNIYREKAHGFWSVALGATPSS